MTRDFDGLIEEARSTMKPVLDRITATERCDHGDNPDPNCHYCRTPLSTEEWVAKTGAKVEVEDGVERIVVPD